MTTTRRMVYAQIANAVLAGYPEPESQEFGPNEVVRLTFDSHTAATQWARWFGPDCEAGGYTADVLDTGRSLRCYHGKRSDWSWQIVGREPLPTVEQVTIAALLPDSLPVRCPRCGHDEHLHGEPQGTARVCLECESFCRPLVAWKGRSRVGCEYGGRCEPGDCTGPCGNAVPAGVDGWAIDGRTK